MTFDPNQLGNIRKWKIVDNAGDPGNSLALYGVTQNFDMLIAVYPHNRRAETFGAARTALETIRDALAASNVRICKPSTTTTYQLETV